MSVFTNLCLEIFLFHPFVLRNLIGEWRIPHHIRSGAQRMWQKATPHHFAILKWRA